MTTQEAFEIIKNEMPYESGVINEALKNGDFFVGRVPYHCDNCGQALDWSENSER